MRKRTRMHCWLCFTSSQGEESYNGDGHQRGSTEAQKALHSTNIEVPSLSLKKLKRKTAKFGSKTLIGEGSFGSVYLAQLDDGKEVAVKKLHASDLNVDQFLTQVSMVSRLKHDNVVELLGYCVDGDLRVLAYEFATMGSLHDVLHGKEGAQPGPTLDWMQRLRIAVDAARGLEYLHDKVEPSIIHKAISSNNVLLFEDCKAKIADFNLLYEAPVTSHAQVLKYFHPPELALTGRMTEKSDVYGFGIVLLELLTGRKPFYHTKPFYWAIEILPSLQSLRDNDEVRQFIDPKLNYCPPKGVAKLARVAVMCVSQKEPSRPKMRDVVKGLERIMRMS